MALFCVDRFLGDDEEEEKTVDTQSKSLLKKLKKDAQLRRSSEQNRTSFGGQVVGSTNGLVPCSPSKQNLVSEKLSPSHTGNNSVVQTAENKEQRKRKKRHIRLSTSEVDCLDQNKTTEFQDTKRKKRKSESDHSLFDNVTKKPQSGVSETEAIIASKSWGTKPEISGESPGVSEALVTENVGIGDTENIAQVETAPKLESSDGAGDVYSSVDKNENEVGGFTILGSYGSKKANKVQRILPEWLARPSIITNEIRGQHDPISEMTGLDPLILQRLKANNITHFFPVQMQVIPVLLDSLQHGFLAGKAGYRPNDICVSAPTGSGKTLAYVIPIVQGLQSRVCCEIRALVILPVRDLAAQVYKVFKNYCSGTSLKVGLLVGQKTLLIEQQSLVKKRLRGFQSLVDIIVATPGRLVDHINNTPGFSLGHLRFLVIDEADRIMEDIKQEWLSCVETAVYKGNEQDLLSTLSQRTPSQVLTVGSANKPEMPLQKLLFSATLSQNPEKLQQLNLFQPKLFTSVVTPHRTSNEAETETEAHMTEFIGKYTTPTELTEYFVACTVAEKPLVLLYCLHTLKFRHILCFTNSVEATHRLYHLIKLIGGIEVREFSSSLHGVKRSQILRKFAAGKVDIIICSDAMARGMDIENVKYVVSYDTPSYIKTYIHRIGRTARAGKVGTALTLLQKKEFYHFKKMVREAGKENIKELKVEKKAKKAFVPVLEEALSRLPDVLKGEKKHSGQK